MCHEISEILDAISQQLGKFKFEYIINSQHTNEDSSGLLI
jgi:hypothetical protein